MRAFSSALRREFRVVLSRRAQPVWFRITKWVVLLSLVLAFRQQPIFWCCLLALLLLGLGVHFYYRQKTCAWTRPWGGWNDLDAGRN
jgi:hypothetical protein